MYHHSLCDTDVFIVGGGPAGLAAAVATRQAGLAVTVADFARPPIDKACGEGIMPDGLAALAKLGIHLPADQTLGFRGIRFSDTDSAVEASFPQGRGFGIRRTRLHRILADRAKELGVVMHWGTRVTAITPDRVSLGWDLGSQNSNHRGVFCQPPAFALSSAHRLPRASPLVLRRCLPDWVEGTPMLKHGPGAD